MVRSEGTDGEVKCEIKTHPLVEGTPHDDNAVEYEDYQPSNQIVIFEHGESKKTVTIELVNEKPTNHGITDGKLDADDAEDENNE